MWRRMIILALTYTLSQVVLARTLLQDTSTTSQLAPLGAACSTWPESAQGTCCDAKWLAGVFDPFCTWGGTSCSSQPSNAVAQCCTDKAAGGVYDPSCPISDSCASWPPVHRKQCCGDKAWRGTTDFGCFELLDCSAWSGAPDLYQQCCGVKIAMGVHDASCPMVEGACITVPLGDRMQCCERAWASGQYESSCPLGLGCNTWPPQHRTDCCDRKAAEGVQDETCAAGAAAVTGACSTWGPQDIPWCCDLKRKAGLFDRLCPEPEVCPFPCGNSCIHSLPKLTIQGQSYFLAYTADTAASVAADYCKHKGYGGAGAMDALTIPSQFQGGAADWRTYNLQTGEVCQGPTCATIGVVECVKAGAAPLAPDSNNNIGCANSGSGNIGSYNSGSSNRGNKNSGSRCWGDYNSGSGLIGSGFTESDRIGNYW